MVVGLSDDLRMGLTLGAQRLPVLPEPKDLADLIENEVNLLSPQCAVTNKEIRRLKEHPAVILDNECAFYQHDSWARTIVLMDRKILLIVNVSTWDKKSRADGAVVANELLASVRRLPKSPPPPEPPELADSTYRDEEFGYEISLPKGWKATLGERGTRVFVENPTQCGTIMIFAEERLEDADAMALMAEHVDTMSKVLPGFSCRGPTALKVGPLRGAQCLSEFEFDKKVKRWRAYFTHKRRLYRIICDAQPAKDYEELKGAFRATVQSFRLKAQPPQPAEPQRPRHLEPKPPAPEEIKE